MLDDVMDVLACPHCGGELQRAGNALRCGNNHVFDIARQGYVSLLPGRGKAAGDTPEMVAARADFLAAGHYAPITEAVTEAVTGTGPVIDIGAGTGHYLAHVLDADPQRCGLALDVSKYACRRAARAHPRMGAAVADAWQALPVRTESAATLLNVFAPRNPADMHRVLRPGGTLIVVVPEAGHLRELVTALGLLSVDEHKQQRLTETLAGRFEQVARKHVEFRMSLNDDETEAAVAMGPSAWHTASGELRTRIAELATPLPVTASVSVLTYRRIP